MSSCPGAPGQWPQWTHCAGRGDPRSVDCAAVASSLSLGPSHTEALQRPPTVLLPLRDSSEFSGLGCPAPVPSTGL